MCVRISKRAEYFTVVEEGNDSVELNGKRKRKKTRRKKTRRMKIRMKMKTMWERKMRTLSLA